MRRFNEDEPINAKDYVTDPDICYTWANHFVVLRDMSITGKFRNLILAINLLAERGWETVSIGGDSNQYMFALVRNSHAKRKQMTEDSDDSPF
jgi:hypothetical protein